MAGCPKEILVRTGEWLMGKYFGTDGFRGEANLTPREAQIQLDRAAAAMVDSEWAILHGRNELAEQFLSQNTSRFHYVDNFGASHQFFTATNHEYLDQDRNLKALFSAYTDKNKNEINKFLHSIQIQNRNASTDFRRGMEQGYKDSSNDAHNDPKIIGKGIISLPRYVYDSSTSDEVGPLDDQQMETNRIALLRLQGRDYDAGRIYEYNHATRQRLMWYQLPVMELAGRIPSKLANKYKLYREGKLSAAQLAAEIKKQAPVVPNGKAFDFTSGTLISNQTVKLTQAQKLSNGTTLPVGTIARLTDKGVEATLPNGKNVSYAGVTEQRALPKPDSSVPKIRPNGTVELFTDSKGVQIPGAVGVSPSDPMAVARDARSMPNIPTGSQARVIANNPYIPKPEGKFTIMDYLPEAARITKKGGEIVINGTPNNKYLRGIPNEAELARMGLRLKYNGPLKEEFKQLKFHQSDGTDLRSSIYKTIVFEKVK